MKKLGHGLGFAGNSRRYGRAPVNTVAPVASGTNEVGETLSVTDGTWTGTSPITYTYQWRRDGVNIGSATNNTYVLVSADAETDVDCVVTATNTFGTGTADSNNITIAAEGDGSLSDVLASTVFDLDATQADSYPGSGTTWANLATVPADGSAQTAYDFRQGDGATSTTYPAFNGSAGSAAAYWSFDGGDRFDLLSGTNTTFLNTIHWSTGGADFWIAFAVHKTDNTWANGSIFATSNGAGNSGVDIAQITTETFRLLQLGAASTSASSAIQTSGDFLVIFSHSHSNNNTRVWVNTGTATDVAHTFSSTTSDANAAARIGANSLLANFLTSETRLYSLAMGNEYLDNTKAAAIIAALETRHSRDYTP